MRLAAIAIGVLLAVRPAAAQDTAAARALNAGDYADAEALARAALAEVEAANAPESLTVAGALDLVVAAAIANGKARDGATLEMARRAVRIKERQLGRGAAAVASSVHNLAAVHDHRGEFLIALPLNERGLAIRRATTPPDSPEIADSLDATARTWLDLQRRPEAERALERSLVIRSQHAAESPFAFARTLELSGRMKRDAGRYQEAAVDLDRALEIWNRVDSSHPDKTGALDVRGFVSFLQGDIPGSRRLWAEAAVLTDRRFDDWHPVRAQSARNLALAEFALGALADARALRERAVAIGERAMAPCDPEVAAQLDDLAISLQYDGDYAAATRMFRRALATIRACIGLNNDTAATVVYNQFVLAREMGGYTEAERLGRLAVRLWTNSLGPWHPFVAFGLNDLADFLASRHQEARADGLFQQVLRIRRRALGPDHPDVAWTLTGLARTKAHLGDLAAAASLVQQAIGIFEKTPPREPDYLPTALALRGILEARRGDYRSARVSLEDALAKRETSLGPKHPLVASTRADIAAVDLALGASQDALRGALTAEASARDLLRFTVRYVPDRRAMEYASARPRGLDLAISVVADSNETAASQVLDAVIQSRGIVLDELAARARAVSVADSKTASIARSLADARRRLAGLMLRTLGGQASEPAVLARAQQEKEDVEETLAAESAALEKELSRVNAGLDDVRRAMPARSALVSFARYERTTYVTRGQRIQRRNIPSYIAFLSWSDRSDVESVPLGPAPLLDELIASWREDAGGRALIAGADPAGAEQANRVIGTRLRQRTWDPIASRVGDVDRIFIVPDGGLNLVNFAALPTQRQRYLLEDAPPLHYLSMERDFILGDQPRPDRGLLLVGGPSYGAVPTPRSTGDRRSGCTAAGPLQFDDLPDSLAEVQDIKAVWLRSAQAGPPQDDVSILTGQAASRSAAINAAHGRRILHLATHGFFLGGCDAPTAGTRSVGGLAPKSRPMPSVVNPLLLAGLAFAGANVPAPQSRHASGILTAEEISALNLQGTEWAVLSACNTGVGEITSGEGVIGLRRAFQVAGVRTIIMSLWSVQDRATRDWMVALYRLRLLEHVDTPQAVRQASLTLLRDRKAKGLSTHPFYWGAFVAAGDWR